MASGCRVPKFGASFPEPAGHKPILEALSAVKKVVVYRHMFLFVMPLNTCYKVLPGELEDVVNEEDVVEDEGAQPERTTVFKEESKPFSGCELQRSITVTLK